jgi:hypothetical protein
MAGAGRTPTREGHAQLVLIDHDGSQWDRPARVNVEAVDSAGRVALARVKFFPLGYDSV